MKRQVLIASVVGFIFFFLDYFAKSMIIQFPTGSVLFTSGPFGVEKLLNQHLFILIPVPTTVLLMLSITVFIAISFSILYFLFKKQYEHAAPFVLVWFGGASNVLDRIVYHATVDYLKIGGLVGNSADLLVIAGLIWFIMQLQIKKQSGFPEYN